MKNETPSVCRGELILALSVLLFLAIVACNERTHRYEKAVEQMHRETAKPAPAQEIRITGTTITSWGGNPTNTPICK